MAGRARAIGGVASVRVGSRQYSLRGSVKWSGQTAVKTAVFGQDETLHGYTTKPRPPFIEGEFSHIPELTTQDYQSIAGDTIVVSLVDGRTLTLTDGMAVGEIDVDWEEGKVPLRFEGSQLQEIPA